jgi:hypothetical protein
VLFLTLVNPSEEKQDDPLENPIGGDEYKEKYGPLQPTMRDLFASSWSTDSAIHLPKPEDSVLIEVSPQQLMSSLMSSTDRFASIKYHLRDISYQPEDSIRKKLDSENWKDLLESSALSLVQSVTTLNDAVNNEEEVRIVFIDIGDDNGLRSDHLYRHAFDWRNQIITYTFAPSNSKPWPCLKALLDKYSTNPGPGK